MNKGMQIFNNEEFGKVRIVEAEGEQWFVGKDIADILGYAKSRNAIAKHVDEDDALKWGIIDNLGRNQETTLINESGLYSLILKSKLPNAKKFKKWVTSEVLPTIRKTGGYVANDDIFVDMYLPFADNQTKLLFRNTLSTVRSQNEIINKQKLEIEHKEDVIIGLVGDIDLATKRQRINQIIKYRSRTKIAQRWNLLYSEFEKKYHLDLARRIEGCNIKPKIKNKIDFIDRSLEMIPELYEIACKVFEDDVTNLVEEWEYIVRR